MVKEDLVQPDLNNMKKKFYISIPIAFREDDVHERNDEIKKYLDEMFPDIEYVSPIDYNHVDIKKVGNQTSIEQNAKFMGRDIEQVILSDAIVLCEGWEKSRGCKIEKYTAELYQKELLYFMGGKLWKYDNNWDKWFEYIN